MSNTPRLILPPGVRRPGIMRNPETGRIFPCCFEDCDNPGDTRIDVKVPHTQPRWKNEDTGEQEQIVYIFCSETHKTLYLVGSSYARQ